MHWNYDHRLWKDQEKLRHLLHEERGWQCEYCGERQWSQLHHAIFRKDKRQPLFDVAVNLQCCCRVCHTEKCLLDTPENREAFMAAQEERGYDVRGWIEGLPLKVK